MNRAELFPFFRELSEQARRELGAVPTTYAAPHRQLLERGEDAGGAYLVLEGALRAYYITDEGREATLYRVERGGTCVLALSSSIGRRPYPAWVQAGPIGGAFVRIPSASFHRLLAAEAAFNRFVLGALSERIFDLMRSLEQLGTNSVLQRVAAFLSQRADAQGDVRITQTALAAEIGTAREVVFRALRTLANRGMIRSSRGSVRILEFDALGRIAAGPGAGLGTP